MNVVIDDAAEVYVKEAKPRRELGTLLASITHDLTVESVERSYFVERRQHYTYPTNRVILVYVSSESFSMAPPSFMKCAFLVIEFAIFSSRSCSDLSHKL